MTREVRSPDSMIRFVAGPDGAVVPDLRRRLPGRGVWVTAERGLVAEAVRRKAFARGLKAPVKAAEDLPNQVEALLADTALASLSMARKAGALVTGSAKIDGLIRSDDCALLLHASDAAADGKRKLDQAVTAVFHMDGRPVAKAEPFTVEQLSEVLGLHNVVHAAIRRGQGGAGAVARVMALERYGERYRQGDPPPDGKGERPRKSS